MPLNTPIRRKLMTIILLTSGTVLLLTSLAFLGYDVLTFRQSTVRNVTTLGEIVAANSTAALAFDNPEDATEVLGALRADRHIVAAGLYDANGNLFAKYPADQANENFPATPTADGFRFDGGYLIGFQPVVQGGNRLGTLHIKSDLNALYERLRLYGGITLLVIALSFLVAYIISIGLQRQISQPLLRLAGTARAVSTDRDYSVRAEPAPGLELGQLTDAFNHMLTQIQEQDLALRNSETRLRGELGRLDLLQRITSAIGERQDLRSIFQVVLRNLEDNLPLDFGCICLYDAGAETLTITSVGAHSGPLAIELAMTEQACIPIDKNGLARCVRGQLVYEPDIRDSQFPFPSRLARGGLSSLVAAPLLVESKVFGVLIAARRVAEGFSSGECEFLRQLSEHVALAAHQAQLYTALQQAYDDLRQSQHTVMQQERLRALGQMASGIAHDINNAISPVALYTESLLEREPNLSDRARDYLQTIQRAIEDVAETVARMREFYRQREPQLLLAPIDLNKLVQQVTDLTRAKWSDLPQERGLVIELKTELAASLPGIMGAEAEIRDALTNLIFNAVDAMTEGGVLSLRTRVQAGANDDPAARMVRVEVGDTGVGMDEETRRRCLEPFFTTKGERGTGLGLAMVYGMITRHSADLEIDSAPGRGTVVSIVFPVATPTAATAVHRPVPASPTQRLRILIVDDDPLLTKSLRDTLEADGHVVISADGGQQGIETFLQARRSGQPFSIVITDLGMPYVDGRKVAAAIKAASPDTPVLMLTGWGQRLLAENDIPPHVDRVLSKPPKLQDLRAAMAELTLAPPGPRA